MAELSQLVNLGGWGFAAIAFVWAGRWIVRRIVEPAMDMLQRYFTESSDHMRRIAVASEEHGKRLDNLDGKFDAIHDDLKALLATHGPGAKP